MASDFADFDAFFAERKAERGPGARLRLYDRDYELPTEAPLAFVLLSESMADRQDVGALREVLAPIFGADALDEWAAAGMADSEFEIVLHWAAANMASPGALTIADAAREVAEADAGKARPPANRAERRAAVKTQPKPRKRATTGARS
ncbi:hypothetical protein ACFC58_36215 [Kitasatospora purpeofusca]|uniref:hypothetical protein n=1 Tax=Kitasatospora purpeofusca TaxID=67352 RepID=UPI0035D7FDF6